MERKLIDYLPLFVQNYREMQQIMNAEQKNVFDLWKCTDSVLNNQFVADCSESGVNRWENILSLTPKATYTLDERKFNIYIALNEQLPYSIKYVTEQLKVFCGENGYTFEVDTDNYIVNVTVEIENATKYESVVSYLKRVIPENMVINIELMYNNHKTLSAYPNQVLSWFTHSELRGLKIPKYLSAEVGNVEQYNAEELENYNVDIVEIYGVRKKV